MKDNEWINSSILYSQHHKKIYRWVIYPIVCLFIFIGVFLFFAKTEVVIRTQAILTPVEIRKIQVPYEAILKENYLKENLEVNQDETLIVLDTEKLITEKSYLELENIKLDEQKAVSKLFVDSIVEGKNNFSLEEDSFGYSNKLNAFMAEKEAVNLSKNQIANTNIVEEENYYKIKSNLEEQIEKKQIEHEEWAKLRTAWVDQKKPTGIAESLVSKYELWQEQIKNVSEELQKQEKITITSQIDEQIALIDGEISILKENISILALPISSKTEIEIQEKRLIQTQEELLAAAKQEIIEINNKFDENSVLINNLNEQIQLGTIKSPINGTLHVTENLNIANELPKGLILAEVYPLSNEENSTFNAQVPASEMTHVKPGLKVNFKLDKKGVSPKIIRGKLIEVSEISTVTENGIYYTIKGELYPEEETFRYGLTGELSMILGKKTYWQKIKDILLNQV